MVASVCGELGGKRKTQPVLSRSDSLADVKIARISI
jgi:hypothetical protein